MTPDLATDCALLIAIPITKERFQEQSAAESGHEYVRLFRQQLSGLSPPSVWQKYSNAVVGPTLRVIEHASARGVLVVTDVTLVAWQRVLAAKRVVSLVAHWREAGFRAELLQRLPNLRGDLLAATGPVALVLSGVLARTTTDDCEGVAQAFNACLRQSVIVAEDTPAGSAWIAHNATDILDRNYTSVVDEFPQWNLPPAGMELVDGVQRPAALVRALPPACDSTFDLRMCHSFILGEALKWAAPDCHVVMNRRPVTPSIQLPLYQGIIDLLATERYDFAGAVAALTAELVRRLK